MRRNGVDTRRPRLLRCGREKTMNQNDASAAVEHLDVSAEELIHEVKAALR